VGLLIYLGDNLETQTQKQFTECLQALITQVNAIPNPNRRGVCKRLVQIQRCETKAE
jgi:hypothetical protein